MQIGNGAKGAAHGGLAGRRVWGIVIGNRERERVAKRTSRVRKPEEREY